MTKSLGKPLVQNTLFMMNNEDDHPDPDRSRDRETIPRPRLLLLILLIPSILTLFFLLLNPGVYGANLFAAMAFSSPVAGIAAGYLFAHDLPNASKKQQIAAGVTMSFVFTIVSAAIAGGGCILAGGGCILIVQIISL